MKLTNKIKNNPWLVAGTLLLLVVAWMLTGIGSEESSEPETAAPERSLTEVRVRQQQAENVERFIDVYGRSEPARTVTLRAETSGRVTEIATERGAYIEAGNDVLRLDVRDRAEQLARARAEVAAARRHYEAEQRLQSEEFAAQTRLADARAQFEAAQAELRRIEVDLENTRIRAPFDGSLQERMVEVGDYVGPGDPVATFVDIDTLIITGSVAETERGNVELGSIATAELITGQVAEGRVRYIDPVAEEATRTFRIELEVDNEDHALPAGVTAQIHLPAGREAAHRVSPAILALDEDGEIGIKTVTDDNTVRFDKIDIIKSTNNGMWVSGLPETANIITVGQGFVKPGEEVIPVFEEDAAGDEVAVTPSASADQATR